MTSVVGPPDAARPSPIGPGPPASATDDRLWVGPRRTLTIGLVLTVTLVAFESLAVATVMPEVKDDLGGLSLYGWVFSAFFLASLLGIVVAGQLADQRGLTLPFTAGLGIFAVGLVIGGAASSMGMLVVGRIAQGFGAGAIPASAYVAIGRGYPARLRPRMFAVISTAWVVPGLAGPALATLIEHAWSWRVVFLGLLPIVGFAGVTALPAMRGLDLPRPGGDPRKPAQQLPVPADPATVAPGRRSPDQRRLGRVAVLVVGVGAVLVATSNAPVVFAVPMATVGLPLAVWAFLGLVPAGTVRLAAGVPATIAVRGILTCGFFASDAYVTLAIVDGRGAATWVGGAALSAASVCWASASWTQARFIDRVGPRRLVITGFSILVVGLVLLLGVALGLPVGVAVLAWAIGGFGMGLAYSPLSVTVLAAAEQGEEGAASAAIQLSDTLGVAVGTGMGGSLIALGAARGWAVSSSTAITFVISVVIVALGVLAARRLPRLLPDDDPAGA